MWQNRAGRTISSYIKTYKDSEVEVMLIHHDIESLSMSLLSAVRIGNYRVGDDRNLSAISQSKWPQEGPDENQASGRILE